MKRSLYMSFEIRSTLKPIQFNRYEERAEPTHKSPSVENPCSIGASNISDGLRCFQENADLFIPGIDEDRKKKLQTIKNTWLSLGNCNLLYRVDEKKKTLEFLGPQEDEGVIAGLWGGYPIYSAYSIRNKSRITKEDLELLARQNYENPEQGKEALVRFFNAKSKGLENPKKHPEAYSFKTTEKFQQLRYLLATSGLLTLQEVQNGVDRMECLLLRDQLQDDPKNLPELLRMTHLLKERHALSEEELHSIAEKVKEAETAARTEKRPLSEEAFVTTSLERPDELAALKPGLSGEEIKMERPTPPPAFTEAAPLLSLTAQEVDAVQTQLHLEEDLIQGLQKLTQLSEIHGMTFELAKALPDPTNPIWEKVCSMSKEDKLEILALLLKCKNKITDQPNAYLMTALFNYPATLLSTFPESTPTEKQIQDLYTEQFNVFAFHMARGMPLIDAHASELACKIAKKLFDHIYPENSSFLAKLQKHKDTYVLNTSLSKEYLKGIAGLIDENLEKGNPEVIAKLEALQTNYSQTKRLQQIEKSVNRKIAKMIAPFSRTIMEHWSKKTKKLYAELPEDAKRSFEASGSEGLRNHFLKKLLQENGVNSFEKLYLQILDQSKEEGEKIIETVLKAIDEQLKITMTPTEPKPLPQKTLKDAMLMTSTFSELETLLGPLAGGMVGRYVGLYHPRPDMMKMPIKGKYVYFAMKNKGFPRLHRENDLENKQQVKASTSHHYFDYCIFRQDNIKQSREDQLSKTFACIVDNPAFFFHHMSVNSMIFDAGQIESLIELELTSPPRSRLLSVTIPHQLDLLLEKLKLSLISSPPEFRSDQLQTLIETYKLAALLKRNLESRNSSVDLSRYKDYEEEFRETFTKELADILSINDFRVIGERYFAKIIDSSRPLTSSDLPIAGMVDSLPKGHIDPIVHARAILRHEMQQQSGDLTPVEIDWDGESEQIILRYGDNEKRTNLSHLRKALGEAGIVSGRRVAPISRGLALQFQNLTGMELSSFKLKQVGLTREIQSTPYSISSDGVLCKGALKLVETPAELRSFLQATDCCFQDNETGVIEVIRQEKSIYTYDTHSKKFKRNSDSALGAFHESGGIVWYPAHSGDVPSLQFSPPYSFEYNLIQKEGSTEWYMESKEHQGYYLSQNPALFKEINLSAQIQNSVVIQNHSGDQILITTLFDHKIEISLKEGRLFCDDPWKLFAFALEAKEDRLLEILSAHWNFSKPSTPFENRVYKSIQQRLLNPDPARIRGMLQMVFADAAMGGDNSILLTCEINIIKQWIDHYLEFIRSKGIGDELPREQERFFLTLIKKRYYKYHGKNRIFRNTGTEDAVRSRLYYKQKVEPAIDARLQRINLDANLKDKQETRIIKPIPKGSLNPEITESDKKHLLQTLTYYQPNNEEPIDFNSFIFNEESLKSNFGALYVLAREGTPHQRAELIKRLDLMQEQIPLAQWFKMVAKRPRHYIKLEKLHHYKNQIEEIEKRLAINPREKHLYSDLQSLKNKLSNPHILFKSPKFYVNPLIKKELKDSYAKAHAPLTHLSHITYTNPMTSFKAPFKTDASLKEILNEIDPIFNRVCTQLKEDSSTIESAIEDTKEALLKREAELIALANNPESDFAFLERKRLGRSLEWPDIIDLVRKNKEYAYGKHLGTPALTDQLIFGVYEYLAVRSRYFQLKNAHNAIKENKTDKAEKILSAKRAYEGNNAQDIEFLFLEAATPKGLYREDQYNKIIDISKQNVSLAKIETGWGKSDYAIPKLNEIDQTVSMPQEISPRIMLRRQAGQIKRLILNIWPGSILRKSKEDLAKKMESASGKPVFQLHFSRSQELDATQLEIMAIQLEKAAKKGLAISMRAEDLAALNLHFLEALEKGNNELLITQFIRILQLIHGPAFATIDEAHLVLDPMQKSIYALGKQLPCPPSSAQSAIELFEIFSNSKTFSEILKNNRPLSPEQTDAARNAIFDNETLIKLADYAGVQGKDFSLFKEYIQGGKRSPQVPPEKAEKLHLIKGYFLSILPATLSGAVNTQFGLSKEFYDRCKFAIPYVKKDMPKESTLSENPSTYQNVDETLFKTLRTYHTVGLTDDNLAELFNFYFLQSKSSAVDEAADGLFKIRQLCEKYPSFEENRVALMTMSSTNRINLLKSLIRNEQIPANRSEWVAPFVKHCVAPQVISYQNTIEITPQDLILMLEKSVSLSATPQEPRIHSPRTAFLDTESADEKLWNTLKTKMEGIHPLPNGQKELAKSIINSCKRNARAVADPSGLSELNRPFVEYLADKMRKDRENCIRDILYFDLQENRFMRFRVADGSLSPYDETEQLARRDSTLTLYDQARSTGTDIPQAPNASLILIASAMSGLDDVGQAVGRMREINQGQSYEVWMAGELNEKDQLLKKWKENESAFKEQKNRIAIEQLMDAEIKVAMLRKLIGLPVHHGTKSSEEVIHTAQDALRLFKRYRAELIRTTSLQPETNYGLIGTPENVTDILDRKQKAALEKCRRYFKGEAHKAVSNHLQEYKALWAKQHGVSLPKQGVDFQLGTSQELSMEKEVAAEVPKVQAPNIPTREHHWNQEKHKWPSRVEKIKFRGRWKSFIFQIPTGIRFYSLRKGLRSSLPSDYRKISDFFSDELLASNNAFDSKVAFRDGFLFSKNWKPLNSVLLIEETIDGNKTYKAVAVDAKDESQIHTLFAKANGKENVKLALYDLSLGAIVDGSPGVVDSDLLNRPKIRELIAEAKLLSGKTEYTRAEQDFLKQKAARLGGQKGEKLLIKFLKAHAPLDMQRIENPEAFLATSLGFLG